MGDFVLTEAEVLRTWSASSNTVPLSTHCQLAKSFEPQRTNGSDTTVIEVKFLPQ